MSSTLETWSFGDALTPAADPQDARLDAAIFGPSLTLLKGMVTSVKTSDGKMYQYLAPPVAAPGLATATTGGTVAANTYYFVATYVTPNGETPASAQASVVTTGATSTITITSPPQADGATGWKLYGGTTNGSTYFVQAAGATTNIGTNVTLTTTPATSGASPPATPSDGTQTPVGLCQYSFVTDSSSKAYRVFGSGASATPSTRVIPESTMPYYKCGTFDPADLYGFDATAVSQFKARTLASGLVRIA